LAHLQALNLSNVRPGEEINALLEVVAKVFQAPTSAMAFFLTGACPHTVYHAHFPVELTAWVLRAAARLHLSLPLVAHRDMCLLYGLRSTSTSFLTPHVSQAQCTHLSLHQLLQSSSMQRSVNTPLRPAGKGCITNTYLNQGGDVTWTNATCLWALVKPHPAVLVVEDMTEDKRCAHACWVELGYRAYMSAPLVASNGHRIGSLCFFDPKPRRFDQRQVRMLANLAEVAVRIIEETCFKLPHLIKESQLARDTFSVLRWVARQALPWLCGPCCAAPAVRASVCTDTVAACVLCATWPLQHTRAMETCRPTPVASSLPGVGTLHTPRPRAITSLAHKPCHRAPAAGASPPRTAPCCWWTCPSPAAPCCTPTPPGST
jgi:hypothetical protein